MEQQEFYLVEVNISKNQTDQNHNYLIEFDGEERKANHPLFQFYIQIDKGKGYQFASIEALHRLGKTIIGSIKITKEDK